MGDLALEIQNKCMGATTALWTLHAMRVQVALGCLDGGLRDGKLPELEFRGIVRRGVKELRECTVAHGDLLQALALTFLAVREEQEEYKLNEFLAQVDEIGNWIDASIKQTQSIIAECAQFTNEAEPKDAKE